MLSHPGVPLVAIVDDEAALRQALEGLLTSAGFRARGFGSAEDFLLGLTAWPPGCVVLDVCLPGMTGLELQRHLASRREALPVVVMTARDDGGRVARQALRAGALAFLRKPFADDELLGAVRSAFAPR